MNETKKKQKVEAEGKRAVALSGVSGDGILVYVCVHACTRMDVHTTQHAHTQHTRNKERECEL